MSEAAAVHVAIEPPGDILGGYPQPAFGLLAFAVLVDLIALTLVAFRYAMFLALRG